MASKPYRYDKVKQSMIYYHISKMVEDDIIMTIDSLFASRVVLFRKNIGKNSGDPEAWRFDIDYRKLNAINAVSPIANSCNR